MDKTVIFAVAGSGKTTLIIDSIDLNKRSLIITYTNNNVAQLRARILEKFGYFPDNIKLFSYFSFLYSFCFKPFLAFEYRLKGINYNRNQARHIKKNQKAYFFDKNNRIYSNRISDLLITESIINEIQNRLKKYFDNIFIDEIQDFAGHDFNFLKEALKIDIKTILVGDFYQHTFDTSRDGTVNKNLHTDYTKYQSEFTKMGFNIDTTRLEKSHRCSPTVCDFITTNLGITIKSNKKDKTDIFLINDSTEIEKIIKDNSVIKLFYQKHYDYNCNSKNWGECKGDNHYEDVCVVLNKTTFTLFSKGKLKDLNPQTRNKLYVACTRSKRNLYFISDDQVKKITASKC